MNKTSKQIFRKTMAATIKSLVAGALLMVATVMLGLPALAQDHKDHHQTAGGDVIIGKKGQVHFTAQVKAGDAVLKPGMYQVMWRGLFTRACNRKKGAGNQPAPPSR